MSERPDSEPDFQLTGDDPMIEQIEAATRTPSGSGNAPEDGAWSLPSPPVATPGGEERTGALDPDEPAWMQHEPDASQ